MVPQPRYCIRCFTLDSPTGRSSLKTSTHTQLPSSTCTIFRPRVHFPFGMWSYLCRTLLVADSSIASVRGANALDMSSAACSSYTLFRMISVQSSTVSFILWRKFYLQTPLSSVSMIISLGDAARWLGRLILRSTGSKAHSNTPTWSDFPLYPSRYSR